MKLSKEDKELLRSWGFDGWELDQIEEALRVDKTTYELGNKRISRKRAIELLGMHDFLSGIARSAFHWSASRLTADGKEILFDSYKLFE